MLWGVRSCRCLKATWHSEIGKDHAVRELDALYGVIPRAADAAAIQLPTFNKSCDSAVRGLRAQCHHSQYCVAVRENQ